MAHAVLCVLLFLTLFNNFHQCFCIGDLINTENCTATCKSGSCIYEDWICDHVEDCSDGSDEMNCGSSTCSAGHIICSINNECIPEVWRCDDSNDCPDGEDEKNCDNDACEDQFQCKDNSRCISSKWRCDFEPDCDDGSDEENCEGHVCSELQCKSGRCILESWRCDGDKDCQDGSDEVNCTYAPQDNRDDCTPDSFKCINSGECIHKAWKCDGEADCLDQSDEDALTCSQYKCREGQFQCSNNKTCIPESFRCDFVIDCLDGSDELDCPTDVSCEDNQFDCNGKGKDCIGREVVCDGHDDCGGGEDEEEAVCGQLGCENHSCSHTCIIWHDQPLCTCPKGMKISNDNKSCEDVNECLNPLTCSHICINKPDGRGYKCMCHPGYEMDWATLRCKAAEEEPRLLFANQHDVRQIQLRSGTYKSVVGQLHTAIAIDFDHSEELVYWSDVSEETISRISLHSKGNLSKTLVTDRVSTPDGLALDWIHKNLYWTDTGKNRIEVASVQDLSVATWKTVLIADKLYEPRAIVLDPRPGRWFLFWSDWGMNPKIERSSLDGSERTVIVSADILWPNGLTVDYEMDRIYWIDVKFHSIFSANYNGEDRRLILYTAFYIRHPFAMAFFEDEIFWSDWETEAIYKVPNYVTPQKARSEVKEVARRLHLPMGILIYHRLKQPIAENVCKNSNCQQLCLPRRGLSLGVKNFTCACSNPGFKLALDGRSCVFNKSQTTFKAKEGSTRPFLPKATDGTQHFLRGGEHHHKKTIAFIVCIFITAIIILFLILLLLYRSYKRRTPKVLNFDNPVYRRTTDDTLVLQRNQKSIPLSPPLLQPLST